MSAQAAKDWSLRSLQVKLIKTGGRLVRYARRLVFQLAEVAVPRVLFWECWKASAGYVRCLAKGGEILTREGGGRSRGAVFL